MLRIRERPTVPTSQDTSLILNRINEESDSNNSGKNYITNDYDEELRFYKRDTGKSKTVSASINNPICSSESIKEIINPTNFVISFLCLYRINSE